MSSSKLVAIALVLLTLPAAADAQGRRSRRAPHEGSAAIGGDIGVFLPSEDALESGLSLEGFYEYYLTPRASVRVGLGWANPDFDRDPDAYLRYVRVPLDVVYNWEGGKVHPFVGAGLGIYFLQFRNNGEDFGDQENKLGATLFGGAEFFTSRTVSVKGELRYHIVSDINSFSPNGAAVSIGLKKYF
jgi:Outer membrane protein beta-barrel domain